MYALSAAAAGVGMLALAQPAEGKIVYTPAHENAVGVKLDLNHDGIADFKFCFWSDFSHSSCTAWSPRPQTATYYDALLVNPLNGTNMIWGANGIASALVAGKRVGANGLFAKGNYFMAHSHSNTFCKDPWCNATRRYLGLKFVIEGKIHYGWARLNVHWSRQKAILTGYAYETVANKAIVTGKTKGPDVITVDPGSLGHLAEGASAIPAWREGK
jgi:hypothetical protein